MPTVHYSTPSSRFFCHVRARARTTNVFHAARIRHRFDHHQSVEEILPTFSSPPGHRSPLLFLAVFGFLHIIFLFFGDIMFSYGVMGMIVATMLSLRNKTLGWIIVVLFALNALTGIGIALASMGSTLVNVAGPSNFAVGEASEPTSNYLEYIFGNFF